MKTAGGYIALIAGVFGTLSAIATLFVGGFVTVFPGSLGGAAGAKWASMGSTTVDLGWGGVFFAFFTIVLGAVAIGASNKIPGILLIIFSILGAFLGGTLVAIWMAIALVGGILAIVGVGQERKDLTATTDN